MARRRKDAFLVTMWVEPGQHSDQGDAWRGSLEHLQTRERRYFSTFIDLVALLSQYLRSGDARSSAEGTGSPPE